MSGLGRKSFYVTIGALLNAGFGFAFQLVMANNLGISSEADLYALGVMIPTLLATILVGSAPSVLVPILVRNAPMGKRSPIRMFTGPTICVLVVYLTVVVLSVPISSLLSRDSSSTQQTLAGFLVVSATAIPISWVTAISQAVLIANERFLNVGIAGAVNSLTLLAVGSIYLSNGSASYQLCWAFVGGYAAQAIIQISAARKFLTVGSPHPGSAITKSFIILLGSAMLYKSQPILERSMAASFTGGPAVINYADKVGQVALLASTLGLSLISLQTISSAVADGGKLKGYFESVKITHLLIVFSAPIASVGFLCSQDIVQILYDRGEFDHEATGLVSAVVKITMLGIYFSAISGPTVNYLYATSRFKYVVAISVATTIAGLAVSLLAREFLGLRGVVIGGMCAFVANYVVYSISASVMTRRSPWRPLFVPFVSLGGTIAVCAVIIRSVDPPSGGTANAIMRILVGLSVALLCSVTIFFALRSSNARSVSNAR
ncbi:lipid II flippase MurJ [Rhodococcus jostii]|uniref:lipid II flippase MurJ n=1 Tax=Rhodococcus jostii TaxID=132919 RepID=UPI003625B634